MTDVTELLEPIRRLHAMIRGEVVATCERTSLDDLATISADGEGDTIYAIDRVSERRLVNYFNEVIASKVPIVLVGEGLARGGKMVLPDGASEDDAVWRIIVDPIDGTRGTMYQKRSSWVLTGVAPNRGASTNLGDIVLAVQTEIPLIKQHLSDVVWAIEGKGAGAERYDRLTGESRALDLRPSRATTIAHGFAMISRFFPGMRQELAAIDDEIVLGALGPVQRGKAQCFEDQYICSGGQLYELMSGHDRFIADIRPLLEPLLAKQGLSLGICCHPYDLCTELIARELGVVVTDAGGGPLSAPLNVTADVTWVGYANVEIRAQIEPLFQKALRKRRLLQR